MQSTPSDVPGSEGASPSVAARPTERRGGVMLGILLIALGGFFLAERVVGFDLAVYGWPLFVIVPGLVLFAGALATPDVRAGAGLATAGGITTMVGLVLAVQNATGLWATWAYAWALVGPGGSGVGLFLYGLLRGQSDLVTAGLRTLGVALALFAGFGLFRGCHRPLRRAVPGRFGGLPDGPDRRRHRPRGPQPRSRPPQHITGSRRRPIPTPVAGGPVPRSGYASHEYSGAIRRPRAPETGDFCTSDSPHEYSERIGAGMRRGRRIDSPHEYSERIGAELLALTRPTSCRPVRAPHRSSPAAAQLGQSTATITNSASPRGVRTWTVSPAFLPTSALPTGDMFEIRPAEGSASGGPTSS